MEAGREVRLLEDRQAGPGVPDRRDQLGARRAARQVGLDVEPFAAVDVAGLEGGELLVVGMVRHDWLLLGGAGRGRCGPVATPGEGGRAL